MTERVEAMRAELLQIVRELSTTGIYSIHGLAVSMHEREAGERAIAELAALKAAGFKAKRQRRKRVKMGGNVVAFNGTDPAA